MCRQIRNTLLAAVLLAACAPMREIISINSVYDQREVKWALVDGTGSVEGSGFLSRNDGILVKCAGKPVGLIPYAEYASERITKIYQSEQGGYRPFYVARYRQIEKPASQYVSDRRTKTCDVDGKFSFAKVPAGKYYVVTRVAWFVNNQWQGGDLAKLIEVGEGDTVSVVLTQ